MAKKDITGHRFGHLVAERFSRVRASGEARSTMWLFRCDCGEIVERAYRDVASQRSRTRSCGCRKGALIRAAKVTHGRSYRRGAGVDPTYAAWIGAKSRCYGENDPHFPNWGGRGIVMCDEWRNNFEKFLSDMGERPHGSTLDRCDNDGPYSLANCRWSTARTQVNNRRLTVMVEYLGRPTPLSFVAEAENKNYFSLYNYLIKRPRPLDEALALATSPFYGTKCGRRRTAPTKSATKAA